MSDVMIRTKIPMYIISGLATLLVIDYFIHIEVLAAFKTEMVAWTVILFNFAALVGAAIVLRLYSTNAMTSKDTGTRLNGAVAVASFIVFIAVALMYGPNSYEYQIMYTSTIYPIGSCIWGLTFIYSGMAVYRAFKFSSLESIALFLCGVAIFLKEMPIVAAYFPPITGIGEWVMTYAGGSSYRVGILATALGALIVGIRTIMGKETSSVR